MNKFICNACDNIFELSESTAKFCPECGESSVELYEEYFDYTNINDDPSQDFDLDIIDEETTKGSKLSRYLNIPIFGLIFLIIIITSFFGCIAFHIWTTYLVYNHWGTFWAIIAFLSPPLPELVIAVACFWWGMWFYILAIPTIIIGWILTGLMGALAEDEESWSLKIGATVCIIIFLALCYVFGTYTWNYYKSPSPITNREQSELVDTATAIMLIFGTSWGSEPALQAKSIDSKSDIRKRISKYNKSRVDVICEYVDKYLEFEKSIEIDIMKNVSIFTQNENANFRLSNETKSHFKGLPKKMRATIADEDITKSEIGLSKVYIMLFRNMSSIKNGTTKSDQLDYLKFQLDRKWQIIKQDYEDMFGRPMPNIYNKNKSLRTYDASDSK